jgi:hypothetical protein
MTFDRNAFEQQQKESVTLDESEAKSEVKLFENNNDFHKYSSEGIHSFRIAPAHEPDKHPFAQPVQRVSLPSEYEGKEQRKKVFISLTHGNPEFKDIVVEYVRAVYNKIYDEYQDKDEAKKKLAPVNGFRTADKKWIAGIKPDRYPNWMVYAWDKDKKLARLELYNKIVQGMKTQSIDPANPSVTPSPAITFGDINNGRILSIVVKKVRTDNGEKTERSVLKGDSPRRLSDERMEELFNVKPLADIYSNVYNRDMFLTAKVGLEYFDNKYEYGIFNDPDFLKVVEEIEACYPLEAPTEATEQTDSSDDSIGNTEQETDDLPF